MNQTRIHGAHRAMLHEGCRTGRGRAVGQAPPLEARNSCDVPIVLQEVVELDHVVDRERRARPAGAPRIVLVSSKSSGWPSAALALVDVDAGRDQQRHDLAVGALLDVVARSWGR